MTGISDAIGTFFEEKLLAAIPDLEDFRYDRNMPDFRFGRLWIEAKAAFHASDYGILPKPYQFPQHQSFTPFLYACGYHDFEGAMHRLGQLKTQRGRVRHLHRNASIDRMVFASASVIERMYEKDKRVSKKEGREYCAISPRDFERVINDEHMRRGSDIVRARDFYGIHDCVYSTPDPIGYVLTPVDRKLLSPLLQRIDTAKLFHNPLDIAA